MGRKGAHRRPRRRHHAVVRVCLTIATAWFFTALPSDAASEPRQVARPAPQIAAATPATPVAFDVPVEPEVTVAPTPPVVATPAARRAAPQRLSGTVALTFDDGPNEIYTPQILDILARYAVLATFFVTGEAVERHPELARRIVAEGHRVANHTWNHPNVAALSADEVAWQMDTTNAVIASLTGVRSSCFRPPYGRTNQLVAAAAHARGMRIAKWSNDSHDWKRPGAASIVSQSLAGAVPGGVILFHDSGPDMSQTVDALPAIVEGIQGRGLQVAPIC